MSKIWPEPMTPGNLGAVADCLPDTPLLLPATTSLGQAIERLLESNLDIALVVENGLAIGSLRPRDLVSAVSAGIAFDQPVAPYVTAGLVTIAASAHIHAAYRLLLTRDVDHLLVLDAMQKPLGLISGSDIVAGLGRGTDPASTKAAALMSPDLVCVSAASSIRAASSDMQLRHSDCVLVRVDGKPLGLMTENDVLRFLRHVSKNSIALGPISDWQDRPVSAIMAQPVETIDAEADLATAAARLRDSGKNRLIVIDGDGRAIGVLAAAALVKAQHHDLVAMLKALVREQTTAIDSDAFRTVVEHLPDCILIKDLQSVYIGCNKNFARLVGRAIPEIIGKRDADFCPPDLADRYGRDDRRLLQLGSTETYQETFHSADGKSWFHSSKAPIFDADGKATGIIVVFRDITERRHAQDELLRRNWALQALSRCNQALVRTASEDELLQDVCDAITEDNRYCLAWIGWAELDAAKSLRIAAAAGIARHYVDDLQISWGDNERGNGPSGKSIRFNRTELNIHGLDDISFAPWRDRAIEAGIRAAIAIPLRIEDRAVGTLVISSDNADLFTESEITLFEEIADNLAFGIQARRIALARVQAMLEIVVQATKTEHALEEALAAVASMLELRDPYTAGHQRRVAALAGEIGIELGLDAARLKAIDLAGIVHDIGKIHVPVEILTKPGRLTAGEFAVVQQHPTIGYDLLKGIDFPWPIAEIVDQHHESLDGSGYPRGLKGDQILLESRIITVADIIDAMSAARPYRAALGLAAARAEIQRQRGGKLDPAVVDACLRVLDRGAFTPQPAMPASAA
jgi:PAS domain S-box-containing protein